MAGTINDNGEQPSLRLSWSGGIPLTWRILAVNIFVIILLVGGFLYLDNLRLRLVEQRLSQLTQQAAMADIIITTAPPERRNDALVALAQSGALRIRIYDANGAATFDTFAQAPPTYTLRDPATQSWNRAVARTMDRALDWVVSAVVPPAYSEPVPDRASAWPELAKAQRAPTRMATSYRLAPDRTPMLAAAYMPQGGAWQLLVMTNARDITRTVRAERYELGVALASVTLISILLSLFLARTIVRPLRHLADAATRVRLGRARDVVVPRLPSRRDEIGQLARALSDMTQALRVRIDAGEDFAADITHELKNPLASLRSAVEGLERVDQPHLRAQLLAIASDDVRRLDRLITDISEASRVDAQLSRTHFERIDMGSMIGAIVEARMARMREGESRIAFARPRLGSAVVQGEPSRLVRVLENLLDNACSFSPPDGIVTISATQAGEQVVIRIEDDGPGVPRDQREVIFRRFHSVRPASEGFGKHSGLGLAIARTIIEAHGGTISALDRDDAARGACFEIRLPAAAQPVPAE